MLLPERRGPTPSINKRLVGMHYRKYSFGAVDAALGDYSGLGAVGQSPVVTRLRNSPVKRRSRRSDAPPNRGIGHSQLAHTGRSPCGTNAEATMPAHVRTRRACRLWPWVALYVHPARLARLSAQKSRTGLSLVGRAAIELPSTPALPAAPSRRITRATSPNVLGTVLRVADQPPTGQKINTASGRADSDRLQRMPTKWATSILIANRTSVGSGTTVLSKPGAVLLRDDIVPPTNGFQRECTA